MIRKIFSSKASILTLLGAVAAFVLLPHIAHADVGALDILTSPIVFVSKIYSTMFEIIILPLAAGILYLAGVMLDSALSFSLHTAYIFSLSPAINLGWVIIRDIVNIFFIFILIRISLGTIVNGLRFGTMSMLKNVIIAALLINFSLFVTKAVIDVSNIFGNWLYGGIQNTLIANSSNANDPVSLSGLIITRLHIMQYWASGAAGANTNLDITDWSKGAINSFIRLTVISITTYVFLYATVLFLTRAVTLLFLLIFSPIGFMGTVLPQVKEYSEEWRRELTSAAMFPIVFLLMLYISLQFINSLDVITKNSNIFWAASNSVGNVSVFGASFNVFDIFKYVLIIFLLQGTLKVAKEYSGELGKKVGGAAESLGKLALSAGAGLGVGVAGFAGRRLIGAAASSLTTNASLNDMAAGKVGTMRVGGIELGKIANQVVGKGILSGLQKTAKSSFDVRATGLPGALGADLGAAGGKDGFKGMVKEREEEEKKFAEGFGDSPEGIERRMAYAENRRNSILTNIAVGNKARGKIADKIRGEAGSAFTKAQTEKAKGDTQGIKNQIIAEQMAQETLERAKKLESFSDINTVLEQEIHRIENMVSNSENDPKNQLSYNRYKRQEAEKNGATETVKKLDDEFNSKTATMLQTDKQKILDKVKDVEELQTYAKDYTEKLKQTIKRGVAESESEAEALLAKKNAVDGLKTFIEGRLGVASTDWDKDARKWKKEGKGLRMKLQQEKVKLEKARREQQAMEGKEASKKPIVGDEKPAEDNEDQVSDEKPDAK